MKRLLRMSLLGLIGTTFVLGILATLAEAKPTFKCEKFCNLSTCVATECCFRPGGTVVCKELPEPCC